MGRYGELLTPSGVLLVGVVVPWRLPICPHISPYLHIYAHISLGGRGRAVATRRPPTRRPGRPA